MPYRKRNLAGGHGSKTKKGVASVNAGKKSNARSKEKMNLTTSRQKAIAKQEKKEKTEFNRDTPKDVSEILTEIRREQLLEKRDSRKLREGDFYEKAQADLVLAKILGELASQAKSLPNRFKQEFGKKVTGDMQAALRRELIGFAEAARKVTLELN